MRSKLTYTEAKDIDLIRYLAAQAYTVPICDVRRLPGAMSFNYEINHKYIFKLPHEYTQISNWEHISKISPFIRQNVSFQIPILSTKILSLPNKKKIFSCFYEKINGSTFLNDEEFAGKDVFFKYKFFEQLSEAMIQIHHIPIQKIENHLPTKLEQLEKCFFQNRNYHSLVFKRTFRKLLKDDCLGLGTSGDRLAQFSHTDLHCGNVLLDQKNNLTAVLDFDTSVRGDYFLEFRPNLYSNIPDMNLFNEVFQKHTGIKINPKEIKQLEIVQKNLLWLSSVFELYKTLKESDKEKFLINAIQKRKHALGCIQ